MDLTGLAAMRASSLAGVASYAESSRPLPESVSPSSITNYQVRLCAKLTEFYGGADAMTARAETLDSLAVSSRVDAISSQMEEGRKIVEVVAAMADNDLRGQIVDVAQHLKNMMVPG